MLRASKRTNRVAALAAAATALGLAALAPSASAAPLPASYGPPLEKFQQDFAGPEQTAIADFDGDGNRDIVAVSFNGQPGDDPNDIALMKGDGAGNFAAPTGINTTDGVRR
ncbi:MAG: hypothetical protein QOJ29_1772, partial [Thermoleophilaceae bacterium]|nr:hypothetical protein [Thermoleophilaceae bacterium]